MVLFHHRYSSVLHYANFPVKITKITKKEKFLPRMQCPALHPHNFSLAFLKANVSYQTQIVVDSPSPIQILGRIVYIHKICIANIQK